MTGRGQGFCVLTTSKENPSQVKGFAGLQGVPVGQVNGDYENSEKGGVNMPFGDGTGPAGMGPMTGRAAGFCVGYPVPGYMNPAVSRAGFYGVYGYSAGYGIPYAGRANSWLRRGFGFGRGRGWGRGRGRGRRAWQ
jgi:hypothetical protein